MRSALQFLPKPKPRIKSGLYRHFEGSVYLILWTGRDAGTKEEVVIYQSTEKSKEFGDYAVWTRTLSNFLSTTEVQGKQIPIFSPLDELETIDFSYTILNQQNNK